MAHCKIGIRYVTSLMIVHCALWFTICEAWKKGTTIHLTNHCVTSLEALPSSLLSSHPSSSSRGKACSMEWHLVNIFPTETQSNEIYNNGLNAYAALYGFPSLAISTIISKPRQVPQIGKKSPAKFAWKGKKYFSAKWQNTCFKHLLCHLEESIACISVAWMEDRSCTSWYQQPIHPSKHLRKFKIT